MTRKCRPARYFNERGERRCARCRVYKPLTEFNRSIRNKSGYSAYCRNCDNAMTAERARRRRGVADVRTVFVDAALAVLPAETFDRVMDEARRRVEEYNASAERGE